MGTGLGQSEKKKTNEEEKEDFKVLIKLKESGNARTGVSRKERDEGLPVGC